MKQLSFLLIFYMLFGTGMAQQPHVYHPDGRKYQGVNHTIEQINTELEPEGRVYHFNPFIASGDDITTVGFLLFSDSALWVLTHRPQIIDSAINCFDKNAFFNSHEFHIELNAFVMKGVLSADFILNTLGSPSKKRSFTTKNGQFDRWEYPALSIELILENNLVTHTIRKE